MILHLDEESTSRTPFEVQVREFHGSFTVSAHPIDAPLRNPFDSLVEVGLVRDLQESEGDGYIAWCAKLKFDYCAHLTFNPHRTL